MRRILVIAFALSLLCGVSMGGIPQVYVNTFSMTNTFFKPQGLDKEVGGGYLILTNANGPGHLGLDFSCAADFRLTGNQYVTVNTGAQSTVNGATHYGITTGVNQLLPTENGYRGKDFEVHFYTITPESSIISSLASAFLSKGSGEAGINHKVKMGEETYDMGTDATLSDDQVTQTDQIDPNVPQGFGQSTGYKLENTVDECGMSFAGTLYTDSTKTFT